MTIPVRLLSISGSLCLFLLSPCPTMGATFTYDDSPSPIAISDFSCFTRAFTVDAFFVEDLDVRMDIDHTFRGDLDITLISPSGRTIDLTSDNGDGADNLKVDFDDEATASIVGDFTAQTAEVPRRPEGALLAFDEILATGVWSLEICDDGIGDIGLYNSASLDFEGSTSFLEKSGPSSSAASPGEVLTYTIDYQTASPQTLVTATDVLPSDVSYVAQSTSVERISAAATDNFESDSYAGGSGWSGSWVEVGEADGSGTGEVQVTADLPDLALWIGRNTADPGAYRDLDLSGAERAWIDFSYRRVGIPFGEALVMLARTAGSSACSLVGADWTEVSRLGGNGQPDTIYNDQSLQLPSGGLISSGGVCFIVDSTANGSQSVFVNDVVIRTSSASALLDNVPGGTSADLADGVPPSLVTSGDSLSLAGGDELQITYQVVVDDPLDPAVLSLVNSVTVAAAEDPVGLTDSAIVDVAIHALDDAETTEIDQPVSVLVLTNDLNPNGDLSRLGIDSFDTTSANGGSVLLNDNGTPGDASDDFLAYTPAPGFTGTDTFAYTLGDGEKECSLAEPLQAESITWATVSYAAGASSGTGDVDGNAITFAASGLQAAGRPAGNLLTVDSLPAPHNVASPGFISEADGLANGTPEAVLTATFATPLDEEYRILVMDVDAPNGTTEIVILEFFDAFGAQLDPTGWAIESFQSHLDAGHTVTVSSSSVRIESADVLTQDDPLTVITPGSPVQEIRYLTDAFDGTSDFTWGRTICDTFFDTATVTVDVVAATLGNYVWNDVDGDGMQDVGEFGLAGITVELLDSNGMVIATTVTDGLGFYEFTSLVSGDYQVRVVPPAGASITTQGAGGDGSTDSDTDPLTGVTATIALTPGQTNIDGADAGIINATPVMLADFRAVAHEGHVVIEWRTGYEANAAEFELYRASRGGWVRVNERLVHANGAPQGALYRVRDRSAPVAGSSLTYLVVEVTTDGGSVVYGPFHPSLSSRPLAGGEAARLTTSESHSQANVSERGAARAARARDWRAARELRSRTGEGMHPVRVRTDQEGLVKVSVADLAAAWGRPKPVVAAWIRRNRVQVVHDGQGVPYARVPGGIAFFAPRIDNLYSGLNAYWIEHAKGEAMETLRAETATPVDNGSFSSTLGFEQAVYPAVVGVFTTGEDYWLWDRANGADPGLATATVQIEAADPVAGDAEISVEFLGVTEAQHEATIRLNGEPVGTTTWQGRTWHQATWTLDSGDLLDGANEVEIEASSAATHLWLNSIELTYERAMKASEDRLRLAGDGVLSVEGFSTGGIAVFEVSDAGSVARVTGITIDSAADGWRASWLSHGPDAEYIATTFGALYEPVELTSREPVRLRDETGLEYLVLATEGMLEAAGNLASYRESDYSSRAVSVESVYDEFGGGVESPWAIRDYLTYLWHEGGQRLQHVVFAGDGTLDPRDYLGHGDNRVPPVMIGTPFGLFASDATLADVSGDGVPEFAVGRIPALTNPELQAYVDRLIATEAEAGDWTGRGLLIADDGDLAGDFTADSEAAAAHLPLDYQLERVYLDSMATADAEAAVQSEWGAGVGLVHYVGHGGADRFAAEALLSTATVPDLANGSRRPVVAALTCVVGRYELPNYETLGEALVMAEDGGAVAILSPTGLSSSGSANRLHQLFYEALFKPGPTVSLGIALRDALQALAEEAEPDWLLNTYSILGDPAVVVRR